jgi:hypothetical protein
MTSRVTLPLVVLLALLSGLYGLTFSPGYPFDFWWWHSNWRDVVELALAIALILLFMLPAIVLLSATKKIVRKMGTDQLVEAVVACRREPLKSIGRIFRRRRQGQIQLSEEPANTEV